MDAFNRYVEESKECIFEQKKNYYVPVKDGFNAICHGDAWFNNMLFR